MVCVAILYSALTSKAFLPGMLAEDAFA